MSLITWNDSYSVKVKRCDQEHQKLFDLINLLFDAMREGRGGDVADRIVKELEAYTKSHFAAEEALMKQTNYPNLAAHQQQHAKFAADVAKLRADLKAGHATASVPLLSLLKDWLASHIKQTDKEYSAHLNAAGIN
jgi:hemerythrin